MTFTIRQVYRRRVGRAAGPPSAPPATVWRRAVQAHSVTYHNVRVEGETLVRTLGRKSGEGGVAAGLEYTIVVSLVPGGTTSCGEVN